MFRVYQWGLNSNKHNYLALSGFELFGTLSQFQAQGSAFRLSVLDCTAEVSEYTCIIAVVVAAVLPAPAEEWSKQCSPHLIVDDKTGLDYD